MKKVMNGNEAAVYSAYAFSEAAALYPITPSSEMGEIYEQWCEKGCLNLFQEVPAAETMQSEKGVGGLMHGMLRSGILTTTFTCSQGLLLMMPSLYKMAGELLPGVLHVSARALSTNSLCIHGDHSDVMAVRQTGVVMLAASNVQEVAALAAAAHLLSVECSLPVLHFFDGVDTSHEVRDIEVPSYDMLQELLPQEAIRRFKDGAMRNDQPRIYGAAQTNGTFFQQQEVVNPFYQEVPTKLREILARCDPLFGTSLKLVDYVGPEDAETVFVAMGSVADVIKQVVREQEELGKKVGFLNLHLYRPFPVADFLAQLPVTAKNIIVLDRTKDAGGISEPLAADIRNCCFGRELKVIGGRFGLGSKNTTPDQIRAALNEVYKPQGKTRFTLGIVDDITETSLTPIGPTNLTSKAITCIKTWGRGSDGAVSCNRQTAELIGELTSLHVQGKFWYDPRKNNNVTTSELRIGAEEILSSYRLQKVEILSCYHEDYLRKYDLLAELVEGGIFLLNSSRSLTDLEKLLHPNQMKLLADRKIRIYTLNASGIARQYGLGPYINVLMQLALFKISGLLSEDILYPAMAEKIKTHYSVKSPELGQANIDAMREVSGQLREVQIPESWGELYPHEGVELSLIHPQTMQEMILEDHGDQITVGQLAQAGMVQQGCGLGMTQFEKRRLTSEIPIWQSEECLQCNLCATVCPHAAIRPFATEDELTGMEHAASKEFAGQNYRIQVSPLDCTGCKACIDVCPKQCLTMRPLQEQSEEVANWDRLNQKSSYKKGERLNKNNRQTQFKQPLIEFSGACAGCGEPAYVKLLTQLFGTRLMIANATGCSSIWGGTYPYIPYTTDEFGRGPAWGTSLLENNAEYGSGITKGNQLNQDKLQVRLKNAAENELYSQELRQTIRAWLSEAADGQPTEATTNRLLLAITNEHQLTPELQGIYEMRHFIEPKTTWIVGGDGWAYDIDSDGIDYLFSQNRNVNLLILDNGSYANTGGQYTSATPQGARAKFKTQGNSNRRKNLTYLAMQWGNVYVAQVCIGANAEQTLQAFKEAAEYEGPAVVIAYSPCILQGIRFNSYLIEQKKAVESGFWPLLRFDPRKEKRPLRLESPAPSDEELAEFFAGESRFNNPKYCEEQATIIKELQETYQKYTFLKEFLTKKERPKAATKKTDR